MDDQLHEYKTIILGGGPAGISCALEFLSENQSDFILLERAVKLGGQLPLLQGNIRDLGGVYYENGDAYLNSLNYCVEQFQVPYRTGIAIERVDLLGKKIFTASGALTAKAIVLATGIRNRYLDESCAGNLADQIIYRVEGQEEQTWGKLVTVAGGGDNAALAALSAVMHDSGVTIISRSPLCARPDLLAEITNNNRIKLLIGYQIAAIHGEGKIESVEAVNIGTQEKCLIPTQCLVVKIGSIPNSELFAGQVCLDPEGYVIVDKHMQTSLPNVYAAGDIVADRYWRLGTAIGGGVAIAHEILRNMYREAV